MDKHLYLHPNSSHPESVKSAIPYGLGVRVKRICSDKSSYEKKIAQKKKSLDFRNNIKVGFLS